MKPRAKIGWRMLALGLVVLCGHASAGPLAFLTQDHGEVIVVTDVTEAGRLLEPPTPEAPVYFIGRSLGCRLGSIPGDRLPDAATMTRLTAKILARQGYLGSPGDEHPPTLFLVIQWGSISPREGKNLWFLGFEKLNDIAAPTLPGMLGPEVFRRGMRSREVVTVLDLADEAIYAIIITAFDFKTADTPQPEVLWQTRIGFPARGKYMTNALPAMLAVAGPRIGRETVKPLFLDPDSARARVDLGKLEVIGYEGDPEPPPGKGEAGSR